MREDDDEFGHYVPVLRRIIILVAVITAVPVMLWTITAFVRAYVSPAKIPTFHQLASTASINAPTSAEVQSTASERPPAAPMPATPAAPPPVLMATAGAPSNFGADAAAAAKGDRTVEGNNPADAATPVKIASAPPIVPAASNAAATSTLAPPVVARVATDSAGPILAATTVAPPEAEQSPAALPAATPLSGSIPLPRHRPSVADAASAPPTGAATRMAAAGPIPMPRPRPDAAGLSAPAEDSGGNPLGFIKTLFGGNQ
jgi:hypothetical protein